MKSVYIHIPFCTNICSYCDFCKVYYQKKWSIPYLKALSKEIDNKYQGEQIKTLYIGGGTPTSLNIEELTIFFDIIRKLNISQLEEFTIECNIENLTYEKIDLFRKNNVNRLSIGVQTFNNKHLKFLNRKHSKKEVFKLVDYIKKSGINNINLDLMYGFPNQTLEDLKKDLELYLKLDITHLSCYSLIIEEHTKLYINNTKPLLEDINYDMYKYINKKLKNNGFKHYEISNYAKSNYESKHNLVYWNNEEYYGFGLGVSSFLLDKRYENTRSITRYLKGITTIKEEYQTKKIMMQNEMILGLRKIKGINKKEFKQKYQNDVKEVFFIDDLISKDYLKETSTHIFIPENKLFISNNILIRFID